MPSGRRLADGRGSKGRKLGERQANNHRCLHLLASKTLLVLSELGGVSTLSFSGLTCVS